MLINKIRIDSLKNKVSLRVAKKEETKRVYETIEFGKEIKDIKEKMKSLIEFVEENEIISINKDTVDFYYAYVNYIKDKDIEKFIQNYDSQINKEVFITIKDKEYYLDKFNFITKDLTFINKQKAKPFPYKEAVSLIFYINNKTKFDKILIEKSVDKL